MKNLTKKQAKEFARIQSGSILLNPSGEEFDESDASEKDTELCYQFMNMNAMRFLKEGEYNFGSIQEILDYVRKPKT